MISRREWIRVLALGALILLAANLPYALAYLAPEPYVFSGVLFALQDGFSYLAKMREGWRGEWLFTLPYTVQPGAGVFLFTYYLFLGHVARWTGASLELVYHLARIIGGALFLFQAYRFISYFFEKPRIRLAVWLFFFGSSGLGWLTFAFLELPPDFWITESIPYLTLLSNAHFPLAWALMLWIWELALPGLASALSLTRRVGWLALATTLLAQIQPLAVLPAGVVVGGVVLWRTWTRRAVLAVDWLPALTIGVCAGPWAAYTLWVAQTHPVLSLWNAQNLTPSPPLWQALIWGGLPLILALAGVWVAARRRSPIDSLLLIWIGLGIALIYAPLALQRRMAMGLWMPLCLLAVIGLRGVILPRLSSRTARLAALPGALAAGLSNLLVLAAALAAVFVRRPDIFLTRAEAEALALLPPGAVVLAGPETGSLIPTRTDARVIYGHQYETVDAARQKRAVEDFFARRVATAQFFSEHPVDFVYYGPREAALGPAPDLPGWRVVYRRDDVTLYER